MDRIPINDWVRANNPNSDLIWKNGLGEQVTFVRDHLYYLLTRSRDYEWHKDNPVNVISTHTSKSVTLPVFEIITPEMVDGKTWNAHGLAARLILRGNFYNWIVTVESNTYIHDRFRDLFDREHRVLPCYAEGFHTDWVHGPFAEDRKNFTVNLGSKYEVWTFCWLLAHAQAPLS